MQRYDYFLIKQKIRAKKRIFQLLGVLDRTFLRLYSRNFVDMNSTPYIAELQEIAALDNLAEGYRRLQALFSRYLMERTEDAHVSLVGAFAKVDYLLKRHHASPMLSRRVNAARVHLRQVQDEQAQGSNLDFCLTDDLLQRDVAAIRRFMELVEGWTSPDSEDVDEWPAFRHSNDSPNYLRLLVDEVCDNHLVAHTLQGDEALVRWQPTEEDEWAAHVKPGSQLNLIRPRLVDGRWIPEYFIYEPDYLIDISALSRCVTEFADSTEYFLLSRLAQETSSEAILLGNLSGQLLDAELHAEAEKIPYSTHAQHFMRRYALDLLTTPLSEDFHQLAQEQQAHIRAVIREDLPRSVEGFDAEKVLVEPSFISEMLGLQGRMDFLQRDMRVLIEQKSGKGAFVPHDPEPDIPKIQQTHYVQMLLYMALLRYNFREAYERNHRELYAYLMYSRYRNALQGKGFAPELLLRALRLRNNIVAAEQRHAFEGFGDICSWTADSLNRRGIRTTLWTTFQAPKINQVLRPLHEASPLERAYVLRMLQFVAREHWLDKLGNHQKEASGFARVWQCSLQEKLEAGEILLGRVVEADNATSASNNALQTIDSVEFQLTNDHLFSASPFAVEGDAVDGGLASTFRVGDIVFFYAFSEGEVPDARRALVFRASVERITSERISLHLRAEQIDREVFSRQGEMLWAIEHDLMEASSTGLYRGIYSLLSAPQERRDLLLLQRPPVTDATRQLRGDYGTFNDLQRRVLQARDFFLIIGPPGTGKTSFGMLNTLQEELLQEDARVLVLSYTNRAVDEVCSKLVEKGIPFLRMGSRLSSAEAYHPFLWETQVEACRNLQDIQQLLLSSRVIVGTTTALTSRLQLFRLQSFSLAIIDEASQILEPHLLALLSVRHGEGCGIRRFVMIGDHKQLPAVVQQRPQDSRVDEAELQGIGLHDCAQSLFQRLLSRYRHDPSVTFMLTRQGRMHPLIADFPNRAFYGGRLEAVPLPHQQAELPTLVGSSLDELLASRRVLFLPAEAPQQSSSDKVNIVEAKLIASIVASIHRREAGAWDALQSVGIIVPYRHQITAVRQCIEALSLPDTADITIDTVERFQGSQRRTIIYGFTIQRPYQLKFLTSQCFEEDGQVIDRKLNVVMTRAQEHLVLVGNPQLLALNPLFKQLMEAYHPEHK